MKLIVGLGNPGNNYQKTRHNIGFVVIDSYLKSINQVKMMNKFNGEYKDIIINGEKVIFLKPLSYMNLSGEVVKKYIDYFKINIDDLLIIEDDIDLKVGKYKLRQTGTSGGHNGIQNIIDLLETKDIKRLKIGVGKNSVIDIKDYVLGKFSEEDQNIIDNLIPTTHNIINDFINDSFMNVMNKYNNN